MDKKCTPLFLTVKTRNIIKIFILRVIWSKLVLFPPEEGIYALWFRDNSKLEGPQDENHSFWFFSETICSHPRRGTLPCDSGIILNLNIYSANQGSSTEQSEQVWSERKDLSFHRLPDNYLNCCSQNSLEATGTWSIPLCENAEEVSMMF